MDPPHIGSNPQGTGQKWGGTRLPVLPFPSGLREAVRRGWGTPGGRTMVALMCLSWFASLRVGEAASIRVADVRGEKALGFWATKRRIIDGADGPSGLGHGGVACSIIPRGGIGQIGWFLGAAGLRDGYCGVPLRD